MSLAVGVGGSWLVKGKGALHLFMMPYYTVCFIPEAHSRVNTHLTGCCFFSGWLKNVNWQTVFKFKLMKPIHKRYFIPLNFIVSANSTVLTESYLLKGFSPCGGLQMAIFEGGRSV